MKKLSVLLPLLFILGIASFAQQKIINQSCSNEFMTHQADSLKEKYNKEGYVLLKEAYMSMESEYEMPVVVPLNQGTWYEFIFIGEYTSRLYEVRMFDWKEKQVIFRQNKWGDVDGNIINYSYVPQFSEFHMMKPVQINKTKKKGLCGYVMLFKRTGAATGSVQTPSSETAPK